MTFSAKVLNDLATLVQGYRDHIDLCQRVAQDNGDQLMADSLTGAESALAHSGYISEIEGLIGVPQPVNQNTITAEGLEALTTIDGRD